MDLYRIALLNNVTVENVDQIKFGSPGQAFAFAFGKLYPPASQEPSLADHAEVILRLSWYFGKLETDTENCNTAEGLRRELRERARGWAADALRHDQFFFKDALGFKADFKDPEDIKALPYSLSLKQLPLPAHQFILAHLLPRHYADFIRGLANDTDLNTPQEALNLYLQAADDRLTQFSEGQSRRPLHQAEGFTYYNETLRRQLLKELEAAFPAPQPIPAAALKQRENERGGR
ncbi:MAG: hypothetical protein AB7G80_09125 [Dongiaceae bacterium]